ncbi:MAG: CoA transferase, partial [Bacteroidetes bacterium]|nr:CoA transferase [Bacteroidota bacterium]
MTTAKQILESIQQRFRPEKAQGYNTIFHFDITDSESLQYTVQISDAQCQVQQGLHGTADCVVTSSASTYIALETGAANPQMALMSGEVQVSNIAAMMQFSKCFRKLDVGSPMSDEKKHAPSRPEKKGPLAGVRILDFTRLLPGPMATMFLADMGADVIKIEDPDNPDYIRDFEPRSNGMSILYLSLNRNKRSLALNYLSAEGKQTILDLAKTADVLVEQYRPGIMQQMGFGYEALKQINPRLIYVSITGYGQQSSMAMAAGHDLNYIAIAGALGITGTAGGAPVVPGFQLADIAGGSYMAMNAVMAALYQREKTGKGEWVDVSMTDAALPLSALQFAYQQGTKQGIGRGEYELSGGLANYNVYKCADGKYIALGSLEPKFWNKFCARAGKPEWQTEFVKKGEALENLKRDVAVFFVTKTRSEWVEYFKQDDICLTVINELDELEHDPYLNERG